MVQRVGFGSRSCGAINVVAWLVKYAEHESDPAESRVRNRGQVEAREVRISRTIGSSRCGAKANGTNGAAFYRAVWDARDIGGYGLAKSR